MFLICFSDGSFTGTGNELATYNPCLFELAEDDAHFFDDPSSNFLDVELENMLTTDKSKLSGSNTHGHNL